MKSVMQTIFGSENGNCFSACVASILELPIEDVPNFHDFEITEGWNFQFAQFVARHGYNLLFLPEAGLQYFSRLTGTYCIVIGKSPRGEFNHAVVGLGVTHRTKRGVWKHTMNIVHDPHPDGLGIEFPATYIVFFVEIGDTPSKSRGESPMPDDLQAALNAVARVGKKARYMAGGCETDALRDIDTIRDILLLLKKR